MTQIFEMAYTSVTSESPASRARSLRVGFDNTVAENKHQWLWAFLGWLLMLGWYDEIHVTFLVVGHTESKVDSKVFSRLHKYATFQGVQSFFDVVDKAATHLPKPHHIVVIESLYAFREFFKPFLPGVTGHPTPRHFMLFLSEGMPVMKAKQFISGKTWGETVPVLTGMPEYSNLKRYEDSLDPVFPHVEAGLKACLRLGLLGEEGVQFVEQVLKTRSLTKSTPEAPHPCVVVSPDSRRDGEVGLDGQLRQGAAIIPVRVIRGNSPPAIPISKQAQLFRDAQSPLSVLLEARLAAAQGPANLQIKPSAARRLKRKDYAGGMQGGGRRAARARGWKEAEIEAFAGEAKEGGNDGQPAPEPDPSSTGSESDDENDPELHDVEMKIVQEIWSPRPKSDRRWTKKTYTQRLYRLRLTDDEGNTDLRSIVAEDLAPTKDTPAVLAEQNDFYDDVIAEWRKTHPSAPDRPTRPKPPEKRTGATS